MKILVLGAEFVAVDDKAFGVTNPLHVLAQSPIDALDSFLFLLVLSPLRDFV